MTCKDDGMCKTAAICFLEGCQAESPVQGAASSASGAKGAAVKPWAERMGVKVGDLVRPAAAFPYMKEEILDWRALADRSPAVQPVAGQAIALTHEHIATLRQLAARIEAGACLREHWADWIRKIVDAATPAPEQEAAPLDLRKAAQSVVASFSDPHVSIAAVQRQVNMLADALAAPVEQEAAQVAPPGAQEAKPVYQVSSGHQVWVDVGRERYDECAANTHFERRTLYTDPATDIIMNAAQFEVLEFNAKQGGFESALHAVLAALAAPVPATTPAEQPDPIGELQAEARQAKLDEFVHGMRRFGAPADQHDAATAARKKAVLRNELAMIIGCLDGRNGTQKADAVMGWIERYGWPASETFLGAANTNKGGDRG